MLNRLQDVFKSLKKNKVKYVVIGGIAAVLHGVPRTTFDLDILIEATLENCQRLLKALLEAKIGTASLTTAKDVLDHEITIFQDKVRIDVQTRTPGLSFTEAWKNSKKLNLHGYSINIVSRNDLIASKIAAGRKIDLEDVKILKSQNPETEKS